VSDAVAAVEAALARIGAENPRINAFTAILGERALERARAGVSGPLAGTVFAAKNLFDIAGLPTVAGSRIDKERKPATRDAALIRRLEAAGAILVGATSMDEYAFGFTTENSHWGPTRNPRDPERVAGGSSGGSAAAVAADMVPLALGSDTNGSIRVPAALCGVFGLKPTYGRLPRTGTRLFAASFDHVGPFARSVAGLAAAYDAMQGPDAEDPACAQRPTEPTSGELPRGADGLRLALLGGHFAGNADEEALAVVAEAARRLGVTRTVEIPEAHRARAASFVITSAEGANLHLPDLRRRPDDFDALTRDRFLAGALAPATWYMQAQRFRSWYRARVLEIFRDVDVLLAPATPCVAPRIGQETITIAGKEVPMRPTLGIFTAPISFIGLPAVVVPAKRPPGALPLGIQAIAAPWREDLALRVARTLEEA
jgi:AtzE family amidohydrolase